jgi:hypothetical protein
MLKIHETTTAGGALAPVSLRDDAGTLVLVTDEELPLPDGALEAVMARYGKPLEEGTSLVPVAALDLGDRRLRHVRHLARYDVIARDYLVYERPDAEPLCALATTVAGALDHLGRAARPR